MKRLTKALLPLAVFFCGQPAIAYQIGDWDLHGTLSQGWIHSEDNNFIEDSTDGTFDFREFGLNASTSIGERITLGGQLFGRKYGSIGDDKVYLDWLSATYQLRDEVGFRIGKLKMPYGLYGDTRDVDSLRTQILLPQGVYAESARGSINSMWGGAVFGTMNSNQWGSLDYSLQLGQSDVNEDSGELDRLASSSALKFDDADDGAAGAIKLLWNTPIQGLRLGTTLSWSEFVLSGPTGNFSSTPSTFEADLEEQYFLVTSAEYAWNRATLSAEYLHSRSDTKFVLGSDTNSAVQFGSDASAYYLHADYRATNNMTLGLGYSSSSLKDNTRSTSSRTDNNEKQNGYYVSLRYDLTPNIITKVEQHFSNGRAGLFQAENPDGLEDDWSMTLVKISFVF